MKNKLLAGLVGGMMLLGLVGRAEATLTTIGTATYGSSEYKLIWDENNNGNSVIWLDYSNAPDVWDNQLNWAKSLNAGGVLSYALAANYSISWGNNSWRLPTTVDGVYQFGYEGTTTAGYNITTSEMGHLFYTELGNHGLRNTDGSYNSYSPPDYFLTNVGDFNNLQGDHYWSGTEFYTGLPGAAAWNFTMRAGVQENAGEYGGGYGLAVRSGQVITSGGTESVPEPDAILLLGSGLICLVGAVAVKKTAV